MAVGSRWSARLRESFSGMRTALACTVLGSLALTASCASGATPTRGSAISLASLLRRAPSSAQVALAPGVPPHLGALQFANSVDGWAGGQGIILASRDGGVHWRTQYLGSGGVRGFSFLSPHQGFAATSTGLLATTDGRTWRRLDSQPLAAVAFFSAELGYGLEPRGALPPEGPNGASPEAYRIVRTLDGGRSWQPVAGGFYEAACFLGPQQAVAALQVPGGLVLRRTRDGGTRWEKVLRVPMGYAAQLTCTRDGGAWLLAKGGAGMSQQSYSVYRSGDFGRTWAPVLALSTAGGGAAPGSPTGVAAGPGLAPGVLGASDREHAVMLGICWSCQGGTVAVARTRDGGRVWQSMAAVIPGVAPPPEVIVMPSPTRLWLLSSAGPPGVPGARNLSRIASSSDGGARWRSVGLFGPATPLAVRFVSAEAGYGIGTSGNAGAVLATADGGRVWRRVGELPAGVAGPLGYDPLAVLARGALLVVTGRGLLSSQDGGRHWTRVVLPRGGFGVAGVGFASREAGCVSVYVAGGQRDYASHDGGRSWHVAGIQNVPAAICAASLVDPPLARLAAQLVARLAPPVSSRRGKLPPYFLLSANGGGGSIWIALAGKTASGGRLYALGPGGRGGRVASWPAQKLRPNGISPVDAGLAYLWTSDGRLLETVDGGSAWRQIVTEPAPSAGVP